MIRGSASIDTGQWENKQKKLRKKIKFPAIFSQSVNMRKVTFNAMKPWIKLTIDELLGFEDEVVVGLVINSFEKHATSYPKPDAKDITISIMGFLEQDTIPFMTQLWGHLLDAQSSKLGISTKILKDAQNRAKDKKQLTKDHSQSEATKLRQEINIKKESKYRPNPRRNRNNHQSDRNFQQNNSRYANKKNDDINSYHRRRTRKRFDENEDQIQNPNYSSHRSRFSEHNTHNHNHSHNYINSHFHRGQQQQQQQPREREREQEQHYANRSSDDEQYSKGRRIRNDEEFNQEQLEQNSLNSIWPPSPSPPPILNHHQYRSIKSSHIQQRKNPIDRSPSPPPPLLKDQNETQYHRESKINQQKQKQHYKRSKSRSRSRSRN